MKNEQSGLQQKKMEAAIHLTELSLESALKVTRLLAELARALSRESISNAEALAAAVDPRETMRLRTEHAQRTMRLMTACAQEIAAFDSEVRSRFSRLLTEQLVSGSHDLMDVFQSFFKVLPAQHTDTIEAIELAVARSHTASEQVAAVVAAASDCGTRDAARRPRPAAEYRRALAAGIIPAPFAAEPRAC